MGHAMRQRGFSVMEILIGFFVLSLAFASLGAYTSSQRNGLFKASQLADATQLAVSSLEQMKRTLSDSTVFKQMYDKAQIAPVESSNSRTMNAMPYSVALTVSEGPSADYVLRLKAHVTWKGGHAVDLGVLVPGASTGI